MPPLIGDGVVHDAVVLTSRFKTMLVDEEWERTFDDLIFEKLRRSHRFPSACPAHRYDPPVPTMQFNQPSLSRGTLRFQADQPQSRRHDHCEVGGITVEREHGFRAGFERGAGLEN